MRSFWWQGLPVRSFWWQGASAGTSMQAQAFGQEPPVLGVAPGSLYYDYLQKMPLGSVMEIDCGEDENSEDEEHRWNFDLKKVARAAPGDLTGDKWKGLPTRIGVAVGSMAVLEHVRELLRGEDHIAVSWGKDPRKVKKEQVETGVGEEPTRFFSIGSTISLVSEDEEDMPIESLVPDLLNGAESSLLAPPFGGGRASYEMVSVPLNISTLPCLPSMPRVIRSCV